MAALLAVGLCLTPAISLAEAPPVPAPKPQQNTSVLTPAAKPMHGRHIGPPIPLPKPQAGGAPSVTQGDNGMALAALLTPLSDEDLQVYRAAFRAIEQEQWDDAYRLAQQTQHLPTQKLINWLRLREGRDDPSDFRAIADFLDQNPEWPGARSLSRRAEAIIPASLTSQAVIDWFRAYPPQTLIGTDRYVAALQAQSLEREAASAIRQRWIKGPVSSRQQRGFLADHRGLLTQRDHEARLDRLIWDGEYQAARAMLSLVVQDQRRLAEARLALAEQKPGVDGAIRRVPAHLRQDPGLLYERTRWRRKRLLNDGAADLILAAAGTNSQQSVWWAEREIMARRMLDAGVPGMAYKIAAQHSFDEGLEFAQLEWLAGWVALRSMNRPTLAAQHFATLYNGVTTPISKARGAYWAGRAAEAAQTTEKALAWYQTAAQHATTFYGQLAASRVQWLNGKTEAATLDLDEEAPAERAQRVAFSQSEFVKLVSALDQIGGNASKQVPMFMNLLRRTATSEADYRMIGELAIAMQRPSEAISTAKAAAKEGHSLVELGYPRLEFRTEPVLETALVHAIIRQESGFNPLAHSRVGALGLMQLMPATANQVAREQNLRHNTAWLLSKPDHNVRLGTHYLSDMIERYNGSYVLAIAAYNAGPGRVDEWIDTYGDPRTRAVDVIDWIERIPFRETRNYVQRVLEANQVYRARMAGGVAPVTLDADLLRSRR
ncbi:MAG: lytic transglycosylase domain-containing protein [Pseudomonadota bacterium]